jgi:hypothetical protein
LRARTITIQTIDCVLGIPQDNMAIAGVEGGKAFQLLAKMTSRLASMADLDDIATLVSDEIAALGFGATWIAVLDEPTGHLITVRELIDGRHDPGNGA